MYNWKIKVYLKNGTVLRGIIHCPDDNTGDVANRILTNSTFTGFNGDDDKSKLLIRTSEIAAIDISAM